MLSLLGAGTFTLANTLGLTTGISAIGYGMYEYLKGLDNNNCLCKADELNSLCGDGVLCSKNVRLSVKQSNTHVLMIAPSDSGKSRRFIMHNVNRLKNCSLVVTDPSGEIEKTCKTNKRKYIINPFSNDTIGYDPLLNCKSEFEVRKIAKVILTNGMNSSENIGSHTQDEWIKMATPLLTAYMLLNYKMRKYNFYELVRNICTLPILPMKNSKTVSIYEEIISSGFESAIIEMRSFMQVLNAAQTLSSIRIVMNSCLQLFLDNNLRKLFTRRNIDLSEIRKTESIIYIQIPERHSDYFSPLTATILTQMFDTFLDEDGLQIYCLIDEMANIGIVPSLSKILSTARKRGVSIVGAIQSLNQLSTVYGELLGKELNELFKTLLVCGGLRDSANYISDLLGIKESKVNGTNITKLIMTPDEVRRLDKDEMLIICNNKRPVKDSMMEFVS